VNELDEPQEAYPTTSILLDSLGDWSKSHTNDSLRHSDLGAAVTLMGWVLRRRDHGGLIFVDLRDREGLTQVVFDPQYEAQAHERAHSLRSEFVIAVRGRVRARPDGMTNPKLATGEIEVIVNELKILNSSKTPPFQLEEELDVSENVRLRYRYLDLRRQNMFKNLILRHRAAQLTRRYFDEQGFVDLIIIDGQEIKYIQEIKFEAKAGSPPILWIKLSPIYNVKIKSTNAEIREILSYEKGASK